MAHVTLQAALRAAADHLDAILRAHPDLPCLGDVVVDVHTRNGRAAIQFEPGQDGALEWAHRLYLRSDHKLTLAVVDEEAGEVHYEFEIGDQNWRFDSIPDTGLAEDDGVICYSVAPEPLDVQDTQVITPVEPLKVVRAA
jgi:hypothetical protein